MLDQRRSGTLTPKVFPAPLPAFPQPGCSAPTIGLNANLASLKSGGPLLMRFPGLVIGLLVLQNSVGIALTYVLGIDPLYGLLVGSITPSRCSAT
ncbi:sodium/glutamate symporter family protein [Paraburkholderia fungorum]|uniref:Sodium/glutamate symporter family protein n=1 Tax=Paraburkholderia fungorum TaxID=134537 RepID=A0AAU8TAP7_9BURK|nr:sodium/glutamate symporter family protein [Paraburkholderia fungorum]